MPDPDWYRDSFSWLNANQGVLSLLIFAISAAFAWFSGILSALRRRPKLKIRSIPGPTLCAVVPTGRFVNNFPTHHTCISLYLQVANAGSAPTSIGDITLSYDLETFAFSRLWWKHLFRPHVIVHQIAALQDFQVNVGGGDVKLFPFLMQKSAISGDTAENYLQVGDITNGIVYFEEPEAWGAYQPRNVGQTTKIRVRIEDAFGHKHRQTLRAPIASLAEAKKYNPRFGDSLETIRAHNNDSATES